MRQNLLRRLREFFAPALFAKKRKKAYKPRLESLEDRTTPTATRDLQFGDRFPSGGLKGTIDDLINLSNNGNPAVNGPPLDQLGFALSDPITVQNWRNSHRGNANADAVKRAQVVELVRR